MERVQDSAVEFRNMRFKQYLDCFDIPGSGNCQILLASQGHASTRSVRNQAIPTPKDACRGNSASIGAK